MCGRFVQKTPLGEIQVLFEPEPAQPFGQIHVELPKRQSLGSTVFHRR